MKPTPAPPPRVNASQRRKPAEPIADDVEPKPRRLVDSLQISAELGVWADSGDPLTAYREDRASFVFFRLAAVVDHTDGPGPLIFEALDGEETPSGPMLFVADSRDAKIQFRLELPLPGPAHAGEPDASRVSGLVTAFPDELIKLQRRTSSRLDLPLGQPYSASFTLGARRYDLSLEDLSMGGLSFRASPLEARPLQPGKKLTHARIELGPGRVIEVDLEIRVCRPLRAYLLGEQVHIGCRFVDLSADAKMALKQATDKVRAGQRIAAAKGRNPRG